MKCPFCRADDTQVIDSREVVDDNQVRRRRECKKCSERFTTYEKSSLNLPRIIKNDKTCVTFDESKIRAGLLKAAEKRPVSSEKIEQIIDKIKQYLIKNGNREISSQRIGQELMKHLKKIDKIAYIRFASVYRSFKDMQEFRDEIDKLIK
ncbi:MAG: transcriptional regulator NrdR [Gammaproteobacteria bacterium]|nr:MAG: transcriptional regulator NrdR [Gammaproteobacteria bacterium]